MDDSRLLRVAKAIADPTRYALLKAIASRGEVSCGQLAELFPIAQATVSHHLNVLVNAELVEMRKQGQHHYFRLRQETVQQFGQTLVNSLRAPEAAEQLSTRATAGEAS
ncbi:MAG: metalloregulator ArsR/SmtB family transcription factor [Armatimonadota bacterium]|nr:metalloregulator ArsR/SmtB family transcription factor [Armatimonadota bacterium]MDW8105530.1 metalloregulator ArsR/SmtB family transcription factor [Armatimonadota bacterium]